MKRAVTIIVGVVTVCLAAYLTWLNPSEVEFRFTPSRSLHAPLGALTVCGLLAGAVLVLAVVMIQAGRRAFATWRQERQQRRSERIGQWEERGERLVWEGDVQEGRGLLQKAWQRRPESPHAVLALATSYRDTGELSRAQKLLEQAANQHHTNPDVLLALAEVHGALGNRAASLDVLERLRALHPHAPRGLCALRDHYVAAGRWQEAVTLQEALLTELRDPAQGARERDYLTVLRYQASLDLTDPGQRITALETLADSRSGATPIVVSLGDALLAGHRGDEASVLWERGLRATPRTVFVERLSAIATEARHRDRLRMLLRKLRTDAVRSDNVHLLIAQLHLLDGSVDDAARELEAVADPEHAPAMLHRLWGAVHRRRGQQEQAVLAYTRADTAAPPYQCSACQHPAAEWTGYCTQCGHWDSYRAAVEIAVQ